MLKRLTHEWDDPVILFFFEGVSGNFVDRWNCLGGVEGGHMICE